MIDAAITQNIAKVRDRIRQAAVKSQRNPASITLLAVSKTRPASAVMAACEAGITDIGENYLQEALAKQALLSSLPLCWHFIGPLQSNKTSACANQFDWVHSVDRLKIARRLSAARQPQLPPLQICLQVNIDAEERKSGISLAELRALALAVVELPQLQLRGLMAIPAPTTDQGAQRAAFAQLREALVRLREQLPRSHASRFDCLSMGMSADYEIAVEEGATHIRIGTALFGPREERT